MSYNTSRSLAEILDSVRSGAWGSDVASDERSIPVRVIRNSDISEDRRILIDNLPRRYVSKRELENSIVSNRDTLLVASGYIGKSARLRRHKSKEPVIASNFVRIISPKDTTDPGYLFWLLGTNTAINFMKQVSAGTSLKNLPTSFFKEYKIPFNPSVKYQKGIAKILDVIEEAIVCHEDTISHTEQLRRALMNELLTRGLPGNHTEWETVPSLGTIPAAWQVVKLDDIVEIIGGSTPSRKVKEYWGCGIPWIVPSELTGLAGKYLTSTKESITEAGLQSSNLKIIPPQSVLVTTRATIGITAITLIPVTTNQGFQNLVPKTGIDTLWLYYYMSLIKKELIRRASGSTFLEISRDNVRSLTIALPSLQEQIAIAMVLNSIDTLIENYKTEYDTMRTVNQSLIDYVFTVNNVASIRSNDIKVVSE